MEENKINPSEDQVEVEASTEAAPESALESEAPAE